jgi:chemotaxis protein CheX
MSYAYSEPFCNSFLGIMPQFGIENVSLADVEKCGSHIETPGVVCIIGLIGDLKGNVIFAMHTDCAKKIASLMMGGMDVEDFDDTAQSAIAELGNMLSGTACTELSTLGMTVDVSTPTLMHGTFSVSASQENVIKVTMKVEDQPFYIYVSVEKKR